MNAPDWADLLLPDLSKNSCLAPDADARDDNSIGFSAASALRLLVQVTRNL